jgi:hypothetical protein
MPSKAGLSDISSDWEESHAINEAITYLNLRSMLSLLDNLLRQVLMNNVTGLRPVLPTLPVAVVSPEQVRFEPPDDDWHSAVVQLRRNALSVYLVDLRENRKLHPTTCGGGRTSN